MNRSYNEVITDEECPYLTKNVTWITFLRQIFINSGVWVIYFSLGLCFGAPTVLITQMRKESNHEAISTEMESWLTSVHGYSALPFVLIVPFAAVKFGRKKPLTLVFLITSVANIVFYCGTTTTHILVSEMMQGILLGSNLTLLLPACTEYSSPHYRGMFIIIKEVGFYFGVWVANAIGTFSHWRNIGIVGILCCAYSLTIVLWPESPSWLAMRGRYEDAATAHHWLKGYDEVSEKELQDLIKSQKKQQEMRQSSKSMSIREKLRLTLDTITTKAFYYPLLLTITMISLLHFSGKFVCIMYAVQLIHQITNDEETAYVGMLLLEGISIFGMGLGCFISRYFKWKSLLLTNTCIAVISLYVIALYLYLINLNVLKENVYISLTLLVMFSVTISCPLIITPPIMGEVISLKYKCLSLLLLTLYAEFLMATVLKLAPAIFKLLELHGAFLFYAITSSILTLVLLIYLPETKGKSLQEVEDYFSGK